MPEEFDIQKLKSEYPEVFKQFSPELLEFIFSKETSLKIAEICSENGIENEEKIEKIAYRITLALLDQVPKKNLAKILEKGANIDSEIAKKISIKIKQSIFSEAPIIGQKEVQSKETDSLSQEEPLFSEKEKLKTKSDILEADKTLEKKDEDKERYRNKEMETEEFEREKSEKSSKEDTYRELIE